MFACCARSSFVSNVRIICKGCASSDCTFTTKFALRVFFFFHFKNKKRITLKCCVFKKAFEKRKQEYALLHQEKQPLNSNLKKNGCANESSKSSLANKSLNSSSAAPVTPSTSKTKPTKTGKVKHTSSKPSKPISANLNTNSNSGFSYEDENDDNNTVITTITTTNTSLTNNQTINENESNSANTNNDDFEDELSCSDVNHESTSNRTLTPVKTGVLKKEESQNNNENHLASQGQTLKSPVKKTKPQTDSSSVVLASNANRMAPSPLPLSPSPSHKSSSLLKATNPPSSPKSPISKLSSSKASNPKSTSSHESSNRPKSNQPPHQQHPTTFHPPPALINESEASQRASQTKNFSIESMNGNSTSNPNSSPFPFPMAPHLHGQPNSMEAFNSFIASLNPHQHLNPNNNPNGNKPSSNNNLMPPPLISTHNEHPHLLMNKLMVRN